MIFAKRLTLIVLISFACIGCDQGTKSLASHYLPKNEMHSYLNDTIRIGYTENLGAFLSLGSSLPENARFWLLSVLAGAFLVGLLVYLLCSSKLNSVSIVGFSLIFAGGTSNLYDRIMNEGAVVDFLNIGIGSIRTGVFNIADMYILLGGAVLILFAYPKIHSSA